MAEKSPWITIASEHRTRLRFGIFASAPISMGGSLELRPASYPMAAASTPGKLGNRTCGPHGPQTGFWELTHYSFAGASAGLERVPSRLKPLFAGAPLSRSMYNIASSRHQREV